MDLQNKVFLEIRKTIENMEPGQLLVIEMENAEGKDGTIDKETQA